MDIDAEQGASVFLIVSGRSAPIVLNGSIAAAGDGRLVVDIAEPAVTALPRLAPGTAAELTGDHRTQPRYPTWLDATIYAGNCPEGQAAIVTELSLQGASIEVDTWQGDTFYRLVIEVNGRPLHVECECILDEATWRGVLLHTRFIIVDPEQYHVLEAIVAALRGIFGVAQESLANDRIGSLLV